MKVQGMVDPGRFTVEQIPGTNKSLVRLFQNVEPFKDERFEGFQYDEYHVEAETWNGLAQNVLENYDEFLKTGMENEVDRSNEALFKTVQRMNPDATVAANTVARMMLTTMSLDDCQRIAVSALYEDWEPDRKYETGDTRNAVGQTWECFQAHDASEHPDISPNGDAWFTFWRPLHGTSPETARPFVPVQGAHDTYKAGEFMIWTDGTVRECLRETSFGPNDDPEAWSPAETSQ